MKLAFPVLPVHINQMFGANKAYYQQNFGTNGHMGLDLQAAHGQPVYAAHDGFAFYVGPDAHGGDGVYTRFQDTDGKWYTVIYWHLCAATDPQYAPKVQAVGRQVKKGELVAYADNSGAPFESSGDHLHVGLAECDQNGTFLNQTNGFNGCIDPLPFFDGTYAMDASTDPAASSINLQAAQKAQAGNLPLANLLYSVAGIVRAWTTTNS